MRDSDLRSMKDQLLIETSELLGVCIYSLYMLTSCCNKQCIVVLYVNCVPFHFPFTPTVLTSPSSLSPLDRYLCSLLKHCSDIMVGHSSSPYAFIFSVSPFLLNILPPFHPPSFTSSLPPLLPSSLPSSLPPSLPPLRPPSSLPPSLSSLTLFKAGLRNSYWRRGWKVPKMPVKRLVFRCPLT